MTTPRLLPSFLLCVTLGLLLSPASPGPQVAASRRSGTAGFNTDCSDLRPAHGYHHGAHPAPARARVALGHGLAGRHGAGLRWCRFERPSTGRASDLRSRDGHISVAIDPGDNSTRSPQRNPAHRWARPHRWRRSIGTGAGSDRGVDPANWSAGHHLRSDEREAFRAHCDAPRRRDRLAVGRHCRCDR